VKANAQLTEKIFVGGFFATQKDGSENLSGAAVCYVCLYLYS
jgi:hypothetical protein